MTVQDFDYELPETLIAQTPAEPRDSSRLLVMDRQTGALRHELFPYVLECIQPGDLLIANDTKVIPARLLGKRADTGGRVEVFLLHRRAQRGRSFGRSRHQCGSGGGGWQLRLVWRDSESLSEPNQCQGRDGSRHQ